MGDVVNLNQFRKKRDRAAKAQQRAATVRGQGAPRQRGKQTQAEAARGDGALDGKRIDHEPDEPEGGGRLGPQGD